MDCDWVWIGMGWNGFGPGLESPSLVPVFLLSYLRLGMPRCLVGLG